MKASEDLFNLIKSLKQSEKRYFKLFSSLQKGDKNYLKLFSAIDRQKVYDEEKIKKLFSGNTFIKHLPWEKNNLYKLVLKSLRIHHSGISFTSELTDRIRDAEILFEKSLHDQGDKLLSKAKKTTYAHEQNHLVPLITRLEFKFYPAQNLKQSLREEEVILDRLKNINGYKKIISKLALISSKMQEVKDPKNRKILDKIMRNPLLANEDKIVTYEARYYLYLTYTLLFELRSEDVKSFKYRKKLIELIEGNPGKTEIQPQGYLIALCNLCIGQVQLKKFEEAFQSVQKIKDYSKKAIPENLRIMAFIYYSQLESDLYVTTGEFKKGNTLIKEIQSGLEKFTGEIDLAFITVLNFNVAYLYFGMENYGKCIKWLNKLFSEAGNAREDIQSIGRIFYLIAHYESDTNYTLDPIIKSTYRFLYKKNRLFRFETIILNYIKKISRLTNRKKLPDIYKELRQELIILEKMPSERQVVWDFFDFISWLTSKIEKRPFADCVRRRVSLAS